MDEKFGVALRVSCTVMVLGVLLALPQQAWSEGSAQVGLNQPMYDFDAAGAFATDADSSSLFVDIESVGEVINISACGEANSDTITVEIFDPTGTAVFGAAQTLDDGTGPALGGLVDCADPMSAPLTNPFRHTTTQTGAYRIVFQNLSDNLLDRFDVTVTPDTLTDPDPTVAAGRLWSYSWNYLTGTFGVGGATDANYYALVPGGRPDTNYIWQLDLNQFSGNGYAIVANDLGLDAPNSGYSAPFGAGVSVTYKFPVYVGVPAIADPQPSEPPSISNLRFTDNNGLDEDPGISPGDTVGVQDTGDFVFDTDVEGTYAIFIDADQDGTFGDPGDVLLLGNSVAGTNTVTWDGSDASGTPLAPGQYNAQVSVRMGEYHFIASDVETSGGGVDNGLTIFLSDQSGTLTSTQVFWDDATLVGDTSNLPLGADSSTPAGRHTWGNFSSGGIGNEAYIDTYVYGLTSASTVATFITSTDVPLSGADGATTADTMVEPGQGILITVSDSDLNISETVVESVSVDVVNNSTGELEQIILTETGTNTNVFTATLPTQTSPTPGSNNDGTLAAQAGATATVTYVDQLDSAGDRIERTANILFDGDRDGDLLGDRLDTDDDGDGIPDSDEHNDSLADGTAEASWTNTSGLSHTPGDSQLRFSTTPPDYNFGPGLAATPSGTQQLITGLGESTFADAKGDDDYAEFSFTTRADMPVGVMIHALSVADPGVTDAASSPYQLAFELSNDNFASAIVLAQDVVIDGVGAFEARVDTPLQQGLIANTTYQLRVYLYGSASDVEDVVFDDFRVFMTNRADTDSDGLYDHLDLDADGDGIPDNVEAQAENLTYRPPSNSDTDGDGLDDEYDTDDGGTAIILANTDLGDELDFQDTDADNDGIPDAIEGFDADGNGVADITPANNDADQDGLDDNYDTVVGPAAGNATGSNASLQNSDGTDNRDWRDADDDNDTTNTLTEGDVGNDADADGTPDYLESSAVDADGDGFSEQADPNEANDCAPSQFGVGCTVDTDADGQPDSVEGAATDTDSDGLFDYQESTLNDADSDGVDDQNDPANNDPCVPSTLVTGCTADSDGDGIIDPVEAANGLDHLDADQDDDGIADGDEDTNGNGVVDGNETNPRVFDSDADGLGDGVESGVTTGVADPDGAGPLSGTAAGFTGDADPTTTTNPLAQDSDADGINDGVEDANLNGSADNPTIGGTGTAGAGETDASNADTDGDGLTDGEEINGSGPLASFGATDPLDTDTDDGGAQDGAEVLGTDITNPTTGNELDDPVDTDGDGMFDAVELALGTDPNDPDTDNDGLSDSAEAGNDASIDAGDTDPLDADSDDDGLSDGQEDANKNGIVDGSETDPLNADSDADGILDGVEAGVPAPGVPGGLSSTGVAYSGTAPGFSGDADPATVTNPVVADTDGDGLDDGTEDANADGAAIFVLGDSSTEGTGETDATNPDTDGDGLSDGDETAGTGPLAGLGSTNPLDTDTDNGGSEDGIEVLSDGTVPTAGNGDDDAAADPDNDGLSNAQEQTLGTSPTTADTDGDGIDDGDEVGNDAVLGMGDTDPLDADTDNDGVSDGAELVGLDGILGTGDETDPLVTDTDGDGLSDGLELGVTSPVAGGITDGVSFAGTDLASFVADADPTTRTNPLNPDSDGDGLSDGLEDANGDGAALFTLGSTGTPGSGETDPNNADTDGDSLLDGIERNAMGALSGLGATDPLDTDSDDGGSWDGVEVLSDATNPTSGNGADDNAADPDGDGLSNAQEAILGTDPGVADTDGDGLSDGAETGGDGIVQLGDTNPLDADSDDDGLSDGAEVFGLDGLPGSGDETDPIQPDTDLDGLSDGLEVGLTTGQLPGASSGAGIPYAGTDGTFIGDQDPSTTTSPTDADSDNDGLADGFEDANGNGRHDLVGGIAGTGTTSSPGDETDPNNPDTDGDLLSDGQEVSGTGLLAGIGSTDPLDTDTDDGGASDRQELADSTLPTAGNGTDDLADADGDGVPNQQDSAPSDPCVPDPTTIACDLDQDGIPNTEENDADGDGIPDVVEQGPDPDNPVDTDTDGIPDFLDDDSDGDGIPDIDEGAGVPDLTGMDSDGDGIDDAIDVDVTGGPDNNGDGIDDTLGNIDSDGDGVPNSLDADSDNDGLPDALEGGADTDGDGLPDFLDADADDDGIADAAESDSTGVDTDGDQIEDRFDVDATGGQDSNNDGIDDSATLTDTDGDGTPDQFDLDSDNDTITDVEEDGGVDANGDGKDDNAKTVGLRVLPIDTDGDGVPNFRDLESNGPGSFDISAGLPELDTDGDGQADSTADADGDGVVDAADPVPSLFGTDADSDGDGVPGSIDIDTDNDGIVDAIEAPGGDFLLDTDGDGIPDYLDLDSDNDGISDAVERAEVNLDLDTDGRIDNLIDENLDGLDDRVSINSVPVDTDDDGIPDFRDLDSDGDTVTDLQEVGLLEFDSDGDGQLDNLTDSDSDGFADNVDGEVTGQRKQISVLTDTDGNGVPNFREWDSDGDGFDDGIENGDFDGNGVMDNLENQNLGDGRLETATRGTGGAMGWELMGLIALGLILLRRSRFAAHGLSALLLVPVLLLPTTVAAAPKCQQLKNNIIQDCWYAQVGVGATHVDPENFSNGWNTTDDNSQGWKFTLGWAFHPRWFAELSYADLGEAGLSNLNPAINALVNDPEIDYQVPSLMLGFWLRPQDVVWNAYLKGGVGDIQNESSDDRIGFEKQTDLQLVFGVGIQFMPKEKSWFLRAEFDSYDRDAWYTGISVGRYFDPNRTF